MRTTRGLRRIACAAALGASACGAGEEASVDATGAGAVVINEVMLHNTNSWRSPAGAATAWIELYNPGAAPIDLAELRLGFGVDAEPAWALPATPLPAGAYVVVGADQTLGDAAWPSASAASSVGAVSLWRDGAVVATLAVGPDVARPDVSLGFGLTTWAAPVLVLDEPTPGAANSDGDLTFQPRPPRFSVERGHVEEPFLLALWARGGGEIYLTTDGTAPTVTPALRYAAPIAITTSTTVRALAAYPDLATTTLEVAHTYLFLDEVIAAPTMQPRISQDPSYGPLLRPSLRAQASIFLTTTAALNADAKVPVVVELFDPTGVEPGFSITAGAKKVGSHSLGAYPKNNIRLYFESEFGPTKLRYPLYDVCCAGPGDEPADAFDELTLRSGSHDSLFYLGADQQPWGNGQYVRNRFWQETLGRMGQMTTHGRYVQVFIDRAYAGHFDLQERPDASFLAAYLGGDKSDYADVNGAVQGDLDVWAALQAATSSWETASAWIEVDSLIDHQLLQYVAGNDWDWLTQQNWLAAGPRAQPPAGAPRWRFFAWDCDITLLDPMADVTDPNALARTGLPMDAPDGVFTALRAFPAFRARVAERAALHFAPGGALSDDALRAAYLDVASRVELSLVAESARWGDFAGLDWTVEGDWRPERDRIVNVFFDGRAARVQAQLRQQGILPP